MSISSLFSYDQYFMQLPAFREDPLFGGLHVTWRTSTPHFLRPEEPPNRAEVVYSFLLQAKEGTNSTMLQANVHIVYHLKQPRPCQQQLELDAQRRTMDE